jgi:hypothetical protein
MGKRLWSAVLGVTTIAAACVSRTDGGTISLHPSQDNSIYSENNNSNARGGLFAGRTQGGNLRRALFEFNIAGSGIPAGSIINSVSLSLTQIKDVHGGTHTFDLHKLSAAWGQGTSSGSGQGAGPTLSDATWNFRLFGTSPTSPWAAHGGDFGPTSGTASIGSANSVYTFSSQPGMVADVQNWLNAPNSNFGWIFMAENESTSAPTAREFASREGSQSQQPTLTIAYTPVPEPGTWTLLGAAGLAMSAYRLGRRRIEPIIDRSFTD